MPYIKQEDRPIIDILVNDLAKRLITTGEINYAITKLIVKLAPKTYTEYSLIIGMLECVKLELYRRMVAPYEDGKKAENGDVYPVRTVVWEKVKS